MGGESISGARMKIRGEENAAGALPPVYTPLEREMEKSNKRGKITMYDTSMGDGSGNKG
jgi:hypothetical protein